MELRRGEYGGEEQPERFFAKFFPEAGERCGLPRCRKESGIRENPGAAVSFADYIRQAVFNIPHYGRRRNKIFS